MGLNDATLLIFQKSMNCDVNKNITRKVVKRIVFED